MTNNPAHSRASEDLIRSEAAYWSEFDRANVREGISYRVDIRSTFVPAKIAYAYEDYHFNDIIFGNTIRDILGSVPSGAPLRILEIGCGCGWLSLELARRGHTVTGIDPSEGSIDIARRYAESQGVRVTYRCCTIEEFDSPGPFDLVISFNALHHIPGLERIWHKVRSLLHDRGEFILFEQERNTARNIAERLQRLVSSNRNSPLEAVSSMLRDTALPRYFNASERRGTVVFAKVAGEMIDFLIKKILRRYAMPYGLIRGLMRLDGFLSRHGLCMPEFVLWRLTPRRPEGTGGI